MPGPAQAKLKSWLRQRLITLRKFRNEFVSVGSLCRSHDFSFACVRPGISNVLRKAGGKQDGLLKNNSKLVAQILQFVVAEVNTIKRDLPFSGIVETSQQVHQRSFAGPRRSHNSHANASVHFKCNLFQGGPILSISE